jgi:hypothetical protein
MNGAVHVSATGAKIYFGRGNFDGWCVFLERLPGLAYAPRDTEYFTFFAVLGAATTPRTVYETFRKIYAITTSVTDPAASKLILSEAAKYQGHAAEAEIWFAVIYAAMIAEENKANSRLRKRIKHLGLHQLLMQNFSSTDAASWSRGKQWREIDAECKRLGF